MASIIQNTKQLEACNKVNELINEVKRIDELLNAGHPLKIDGGKKYVIEIQEGLQKGLKQILAKQRRSIVKDITSLAKTYAIALSDEETDILNAKVVSATESKDGKELDDTDLDMDEALLEELTKPDSEKIDEHLA